MRVCQVCGGDVEYHSRPASRPAKLHYEWRMGGAGPHQTEQVCDGSGRPTEERSR